MKFYGNDGDVQCLVLTEDVYGDSLWDIVGEQVIVLARQGYQVQIYEEEKGIVVIKFAYFDEDLTNYRLEWLTSDELEEIYFGREEDEPYDTDYQGCDGNCEDCGYDHNCGIEETHSDTSFDTEYEPEQISLEDAIANEDTFIGLTD